MAAKTPLSTLEEEERRARTRLAAFRARLYDRNAASPMATDIRLRRLVRQWKGAADRLRTARKKPS